MKMLIMLRHVKTTQASFTETLLLGMGLNFVLSTPMSISLSHISLITHPADRTTMLPAITIANWSNVKAP